MTKRLLWEEYQQQYQSAAYAYAQFCELYTRWLKTQKRSMRQHHVAGDKLFIDYCGPTVDIVNPDTGECRQAQIFVATLGASNYTYVEASEGQDSESWLMAHANAFEFFGGVPNLLVPDNLRSAIKKAHRYEPQLNDNYRKLANHYRTAVMPARPYKPKDKAKFDLTIAHDHLGYFGYNKEFKAYIKVISLDCLVNMAKERNRAFFDKLGLPTI